jgi:hypothetical protein
VEVEVRDRLATMPAGIRHHSVPVFAQSFKLGRFADQSDKLGDKTLVHRDRIVKILYVGLGHDEHVHRSLWTHVANNDSSVGFADDFGRNFTGHNATEQTFHVDSGLFADGLRGSAYPR